MKILIELNTLDIASAKQTEITTITDVLQAMALDRLQMQDTAPAGKAVALPETPTAPEAETPKTEPEPAVPPTPAPQKEEPVKKTRAHKKAAEPEAAMKKEEPTAPKETPEETPEEKKPVTADTEEPAIDRTTVQNKLKEIARAGKSKGIKAILTKRNVHKFSELPDDELADVLKEAEAL